MRSQPVLVPALLVVFAFSPAAQTEKVRNDKVVAWEDELAAGERIAVSTANPELLLYLRDGTLE